MSVTDDVSHSLMCPYLASALLASSIHSPTAALSSVQSIGGYVASTPSHVALAGHSRHSLLSTYLL